MITSGLLGLGISERLQGIARSAEERSQADEVHKASAAWLHRGAEHLSPIVKRQRDTIKQNHPWAQRIFEQPQYEQSERLATKVLSRLREAGE